MKFRKKPIIIEAEQWTGTNLKEISKFIGYKPHMGRLKSLWILTLEGSMMAMVNDWIIKGVNGEFYPCKPDIFDKTYDRLK